MKLYFFLFYSILVLAACKDKADNTVPNLFSSEDVFNFAFGQDTSQTFSINSKRDTIIITELGSKVHFPANWCSADSIIHVQIKEYFSLFDILMSGFDLNSEHSNLEHVMAFEIQAYDLDFNKIQEINKPINLELPHPIVDSTVQLYQLNQVEKYTKLSLVDEKINSYKIKSRILKEKVFPDNYYSYAIINFITLPDGTEIIDTTFPEVPIENEKLINDTIIYNAKITLNRLGVFFASRYTSSYWMKNVNIKFNDVDTSNKIYIYTQLCLKYYRKLNVDKELINLEIEKKFPAYILGVGLNKEGKSIFSFTYIDNTMDTLIEIEPFVEMEYSALKLKINEILKVCK